MKTTAALICSAALLAAACSDNTTTPAKDPSTESTTTTSSSSAANGTQAASPASNGVSSPTTDGSYPMGNGKTPDVTTSANSNTGSNTGSNMGSSSPSAMNGSGSAMPTTSTAPSMAPADANADNTKKNERDRKGSTLTAGDQGNGKDEVKITASIRKQVVGSSMSFNAKNVKIITQGTKVTLRGPVKTDQEKAQIESLAKATAGVTDVDNQLEVKK